MKGGAAGLGCLIVTSARHGGGAYWQKRGYLSRVMMGATAGRALMSLKERAAWQTWQMITREVQAGGKDINLLLDRYVGFET